MRNILVTGSSGLIGSILLKKFKGYNLFGIDIKENNYENFELADISDQLNLQKEHIKTL